MSIPKDTVNPPDGATEPDGAEDGAVLDPTRSESERASESSAGSVPDEEVEATQQEGVGDAAVDAEPDPVATAQAEAARLRDQLLRTAADFDNYRKRTRRDVEDAERRGREELLRELLPVFDNLERAVAHAETAPDVDSLADGIAMVRKQFLDTLGKIGIERVESLGQPFDPAVHEAIQQVETDDFEPGTVANEFQAGYRMGARLVRPAMVVVAKRPPSGD